MDNSFYTYSYPDSNQYTCETPSQYLQSQSYVQDVGETVNTPTTQSYGTTWLHPGYAKQPSGQSTYIQQTTELLDLGNVTIDHNTVNAMDMRSLARSAHEDPWQPPSGQVGLLSGRSEKTRAASDSMVIDRMCQEVASSHGDAEMIDSGFGSSVQPSPAFSVAPNHHLYRAYSQQSSQSGFQLAVQTTMQRSKSSKTEVKHCHGPPSSTTSRRRSSFTPIMCEELTPTGDKCFKLMSSRSEQTKHMKQHAKPYKCPLSDCIKATEGFGTPNDRDRHVRDKHKVRGAKDKGYICHLCPSSDGEPKWWPRKDNFKAHIVRKHPDEDLDGMLRDCFHDSRPDDAVSDIGTAISGRPSNYYSQSVTDSDMQYQQEYNANPVLHSSSLLPIPPQYTGELQPWGDSLDMTALQSDELAGLGGAHQADDVLYDNRHVFAGTCQPSWAVTDNAIRLQQRPTASSISSAFPASSILSKQQCLLPHGRCNNTVGLQRTRSKVAFDLGDEDDDDNKDYRNPRKKPRVAEHRDLQTPSLDARGGFCEACQKPIGNEKKHNMRHERPFMCTHPFCFHTAGSKDDFNRHERSMHGIVESWLCTDPKANSSEPCNTYFDMKDRFRQHLRGPAHFASAEEVEQKCIDMRLGKNGEDRFWCGFCETVVPNTGPFKHSDSKDGPYRRRTQHVGKHLDEAGGCRGQDWKCVFMQKKKRDITEQERKDLTSMRLRPGMDEAYSPERAYMERRERARQEWLRQGQEKNRSAKKVGTWP